jgi:bone morphogenetic protein 7
MRAVTTLILIVTFINTINAYSPAGIYVDNGYDQTTIQHAFTKVEKREMELEILNLLGLPNRPRKGAARSFLNKSAPQFLLDVYKSMSEEENGRIKRNADLNLSDEEQNAIDESDLIMTFDSISHHVSGVRHERGKRLWFNVSEVNPADMIVGAELRIYQNSNYTVKNPNAKYVVAAYELTRTQDG